MRTHHRSPSTVASMAIVALLSLLTAAVVVLMPSAPAAAQEEAEQPQANYVTIAGLRSIEAGADHTCGRSDTSQVYCWGRNNRGQLGDGTTDDSNIPVAVATTGTVLDGKAVSKIATGQSHSCALTTDDIVACWGHNQYGQLGNGTTTQSTTAVAADLSSSSLAGKDIVGIEVGQIHSCALASDSSIACWGQGGNGALGNGSSGDRSSPTDITTTGTPLEGATVTRLTLGGFTSCAVTGAAALSCWGSNVHGELGNDAIARSLLPSEPITTGTVLEGKAIADVSVALYSVCALTTDGVLSCWGRNDKGQLGNGGVSSSSRPLSVTIAGTPLENNSPTDLEGDREHHCAIASDAQPVCWGSNVATQLGTSTTEDYSPVPVAVTTAGTPLAGKTLKVIDAGWNHTCAIPADGQAVCWGLNFWGQGGDGSKDPASTPTEVLLQPAVPGAPTIDEVTPLNGGVTLDLTVADDGGLPVTGYLVTPYVNGVAQPTVAFATSDDRITVGALTNGTSYRFQVAAVNGVGGGPASALSSPVTPAIAPTEAVYTPITPCRIVDTREAGGPFANREIRDYQVTGDGSRFAAQGGKANGCFIPEGTVAVEASVTAVSPADSGFFRAWPSGLSMPNATFMNFDRGIDITNTGALPIAEAEGDELRVRNFGGSAQYVIDIQGYYFGLDQEEGSPASEEAMLAAKGAVGIYTPITPCRIVDTRENGGRFTNREIRDYQVTGDGAAFADQGGKTNGCDIPEGSLAVEASVTAVGPATSGFFRAWPSGESMPNATFMNFDTDMDITNTGALTLASEPGHGAGARQELRARNFGGDSHYVIDIQGYFTAVDDEPNMATNMEPQGALYVPITPCRIVDTRENGGRYGNREIRDYQVAGDGDAFAAQGGKADGCDIDEAAVAIEGSVTAVGPATSGFFRAWPSGQSMPNATFMNFDRGMDITNTGSLTITPEGAVGPHTGQYDQLRARNFGGASHYVIDIQGYFVPLPTRPS